MAPGSVLNVELLDAFADKVTTALVSFSTMLGAQGNTEAEEHIGEMASIFESAIATARERVEADEEE